MARLKAFTSYNKMCSFETATPSMRDDETSMITSILDTDAYKLHMQQAVFHQFPDVSATIKFYSRNSDDWLGVYARAIERQVQLMSNVCLTDDEYNYLATLPQFKEDYLDYLRSYRFRPEQVKIEAVPVTCPTNIAPTHDCSDTNNIPPASIHHHTKNLASNCTSQDESTLAASSSDDKGLPTPVWGKHVCAVCQTLHPREQQSSAPSMLSITITGPWLETILWEVPVLAIVSEVVQSHRHPRVGVAEALDTLNRTLDSFVAMSLDEVQESVAVGCVCKDGGSTTVKAGTQPRGECGRHGCIDAAGEARDMTLNEDKLRGLALVDFGTRRRFSGAVQEAVVRALCADCRVAAYMSGTSNFDLARRLGLRAVGTQAHEWFQAFQQLSPDLRQFQSRALQAWLNEYPNMLGIALTDCINMDAFLRDFTFALANAYDGLRHDSGDAEVWALKAIEHYRQLGIDPRSKTLVFSDGLTMEKAAQLYYRFRNEIDVVCGIGTQLTCRIDGVRPLNVVMKMVECNGKPVAKVTDSVGKMLITNNNFVTQLCAAFDVVYNVQ